MKPEKRNLMIEKIIRAEWEMLQSVEGIGGKADCQNDWHTFHIMRYSYYYAWSDQTLRSYMRDLDEAFQEERNLVTEKYAYMMEYTDPDYYNSRLAPYLPKTDEETGAMIDEIADYMIHCDREFALQYPKLGRKGRPVGSEKDSGMETSAESYVKGELKTYSRYTLKFFVDYIRACEKEGVNFAFLVKDKMVKMYGYDSLDDAEQKL
jgi:hypothetical protein